MTEYLVTWQIDIEADTPEEAAREALKIQRDLDSEAKHFEVQEEKDGTHGEVVRVDLNLANGAR